jgi:3-isopropylmalate/(R)-2-methylmalate dehydratase large subunit
MTTSTAGPRTLSQKVWDQHVVRSAEGDPDLLFIDLHLVHEVTSAQDLRQADAGAAHELR